MRVFYILSFVCISLLQKTKIINQIQNLHSRRLNLHRQCMKLHHSLNFAFASEKIWRQGKISVTSLALESYVPLAIYNLSMKYLTPASFTSTLTLAELKKKSHKKYKNDVFTSKALYQKRKQSQQSQQTAGGKIINTSKHFSITSWSTIPTAVKPGIYWLAFTMGQWLLTDNSATVGRILMIFLKFQFR